MPTRKTILALLTAALLLLSFTGGAFAEEPAELQTVEAATVEELLSAIAPNTVIRLTGRSYDLTRAKGYGVFGSKYYNWNGIYEDGSPQQIFDLPQKELTRRFIRKLRVLTFEIESRDFDFIGAGAEIDRYCLQNDMAPKDKYRVRLVIEELVQQILLPRMQTPHMETLIEHAAQESATSVTVL